MQASNKCLDLIKEFEGCRLTAYKDQKGIWTVGWGSTGPDVHEGLTWSQSQANLALLARVNTIAGMIQRAVVPTLSQNQLDALTSFCYNVGQAAFRGSTLIRCLNQRDFQGAAEQLLRWDHVEQAVDPGLLRRRQAEQALFVGDPTTFP